MTINEISTKKDVRYTFGDLSIGDWFKDEENTLYIKIGEAYTEEGTFNAIEVADGSSEWFNNEEKVGCYMGVVTISKDMFDIYKPIMP